jgi:hypothetical protein
MHCMIQVLPTAYDKKFFPLIPSCKPPVNWKFDVKWVI